ncbi:MAG: twin-arginine translocation signal domain-containing protein, partial [Betaproteobacteria bacterium]|nr:twin-arginine translocation signal domain-containing protein [Betaproteobacteria bacterium]
MLDLTVSRRDLLKQVGLGAISAGAIASLPEAMAQSAGIVNWPQKPVRFIVPFVPGGTSDIVSRTTANE